jgi:hypothetical protein
MNPKNPDCRHLLSERGWDPGDLALDPADRDQRLDEVFLFIVNTEPALCACSSCLSREQLEALTAS